MRKLILQMMVSIDGFYRGPKGELDWHNVDREFNEYAADFLNNVGMLIFGRATYQVMAAYWPSENAVKNDPVVAERMNNLPKIVFSRTLKKAEWENTRIIKENINDEILKLKRETGRDIAIFGSSDLALTLIKHGLIDEYRIIVSPIVLGKGKTLFKGYNERLKLRLLKTKTFNSGNVLMYYYPIGK